MTSIEWLLSELEKVNYHPTEAMKMYAKILHKKELINAIPKFILTDEEIEKGAEENTCYMKDFIAGAKWYRETLKKSI